MRDHLSRFSGCLLGLAVADAFAAPFEGVPDWYIMQENGTDGLWKKADLEDHEISYTDDTEMMIGLAESLLCCGRVDQDEMIQKFATNYHAHRGYGQGARKILEAAKQGKTWSRVADTIFPGGSYGNGAAMRVAPLGLLFHHDLNRLWSEAAKSALPTHRHPVGIEAAQVMALAVGLVLQSENVERKVLLKRLRERTQTEEICWALDTAIRLRKGDSFGVLGSGLEAHRSVITAITLFAEERGDFRNAISRCISLGDDTDTLSAMAGCLCGALQGIDVIPDKLLQRLENDKKGREYIRSLAVQLYEKWKLNAS